MSHGKGETVAADAVYSMLQSMVDLQHHLGGEVSDLLRGQARIAEDVAALKEALDSSRPPSRSSCRYSVSSPFRPMQNFDQMRHSARLSTSSACGFENVRTCISAISPSGPNIHALRRSHSAGFENVQLAGTGTISPSGPNIHAVRRAHSAGFENVQPAGTVAISHSDSNMGATGSDGLDRWPQSVPMRSEYKDLFEEQGICKDRSRRSTNVAWKSRPSPTADFQIQILRSSRWVLEPDSWQMMAFDLLMIMPFISDVVVLPFVVAWGMPLGDYLTNLSWCSATYWVIAAVLHFRIGFYREGELVMDGPAIARRYFATWFVPDIALIVVDFVALSTEQLPNFFRLLRLVKVVRIIRFIQVANKLEQMFQGTQASGMRVVTTAGKILIFFVLLNHFVGCLMFAWARVPGGSDTGKRWTDYSPWHASEDYDFWQAPPLYQYVTSMLYVTCMLTLSGAHSIPPNTPEGFIGIVTIICGLMLSGTVVAILSAHVVEMAMAQQEKTTLLNTLGMYLKQRKVNPRLAGRLRRQVLARVEMQAALGEEDVPALSMISKKLRRELLRSTRLSQLLSHPLFSFWDEIDSQASDMMCEGVSFAFLSPQDILFESSDEAKAMYYLDKGKMSYTTQKSWFCSIPTGRRDVDKGKWISEAALWTHWEHVGTMEAINQSQVLAIRPEVIQSALREHPRLTEHTVEYCNAFKDCLDMACPPHSSHPDDLDIPHCHGSDLLGSTSSIALLNSVRSNANNTITSQELDELRKEIEENRCALQIRDRELERIVAVVAIRLERLEDDKIWVQVGKWHAAKGFQADCKLPGKQRRRGEAVQKVVQAILNERLTYFQSSIVLEHAEQEITLKDSKYGIRTKYLRTEYSATLHDVEGPKLYQVFTLPPTIKRYGHSDLDSVQEVGDNNNFDVFLHSTEEEAAVAYSWLPVDRYKSFSSGGKAKLQELLSNMAVSPEKVRENFLLGQEELDGRSSSHSGRALQILEGTIEAARMSQGDERISL
eukprot:TRINITY_DN10173_c0_g2_i1.p1 TRINITY_DN10173_c0_g2~~TRINITY_DN10173_c0_g2_i1.p1  ORF type:complete len:1024 (-),score=158.17 TRINITY_DN10173_c0_g2_i1:89-3088(-)